MRHGRVSFCILVLLVLVAPSLADQQTKAAIAKQYARLDSAWKSNVAARKHRALLAVTAPDSCTGTKAEHR